MSSRSEEVSLKLRVKSSEISKVRQQFSEQKAQQVDIETFRQRKTQYICCGDRRVKELSSQSRWW